VLTLLDFKPILWPYFAQISVVVANLLIEASLKVFFAIETFDLITIGFLTRDTVFLGKILGIGFTAAFGLIIGLFLVAAFSLLSSFALLSAASWAS